MPYLALDVGGTAVKYALGDENCTLSAKGAVPSRFTTHEEFIEAIGAIYDSVPTVEGIAISTCGELDPGTGEMFSGGTLRFNAGTNLIRAVQARCGVPVSLENDANCALIAEMADGALAEYRNGVVLVLGTAVGGAIMIDRQPYYGSHFHSGNVSYLLNNIAEPSASILADTNGVGGLIDDYRTLTGESAEEMSVEAIFRRLAGGDLQAHAALTEFSARLSSVIFNLQLVLDAEVFAIGGGVSSQQALIDAVTLATAQRFKAAPVALPVPAITPCRYRNDANLIGALRHHFATLTGREAAPVAS